MEHNAFRKQIADAFNKHGASAPEISINEGKGTFSLHINGDWYRDHHRADAILLNEGHLKVEETMDSEEGNRDTYKSEHVYEIEKRA